MSLSDFFFFLLKVSPTKALLKLAVPLLKASDPALIRSMKGLDLCRASFLARIFASAIAAFLYYLLYAFCLAFLISFLYAFSSGVLCISFVAPFLIFFKRPIFIYLL